MCMRTLPLMPRTSRTTSDCSPRGGMKSISATVPDDVVKVVSTTMVPGR